MLRNGCADAGYDAAELDNLDSWTRSHRLLTAAGHDAGLAVAQKNSVELAPQGPGIGFDLAIAEECGRWRECVPYAGAYADRAYLVEYAGKPWHAACHAVGARVGVILRDRMVTPAGPYRSC